MTANSLLPSRLLEKINQNPNQVRQDALIYLVGILWQAGEISSQLAAEMLEVEAETVPELLFGHGFTSLRNLADVQEDTSDDVDTTPDPMVGLFSGGSPNLATDAESILEQDIRPQSGWTLKDA